MNFLCLVRDAIEKLAALEDPTNYFNQLTETSKRFGTALGKRFGEGAPTAFALNKPRKAGGVGSKDLVRRAFGMWGKNLHVDPAQAKVQGIRSLSNLLHGKEPLQGVMG